MHISCNRLPTSLLLGTAIFQILTTFVELTLYDGRTHDEAINQLDIPFPFNLTAYSLSKKEKDNVPSCHSWKPQKNLKYAPTDLHPFWVPSFPGSGAEMFRELIEAMTGLEASEGYYVGNFCRSAKAVTCKTHWPVIDPASNVPHAFKFRKDFQKLFFILIRNPAKAIPSYFNWKWEKMHRLQHHTQQAPESDWIEWRNANFDEQLSNWRQLIESWLDLKDFKLALLLPYEEMISEEKGPSALAQVAHELQVANSVNIPKDFGCLWNHVVRRKAIKKRLASYIPSFTKTQSEAMINVLQDLYEKYKDQTTLAETLKSYMIEVSFMER